jgi:hypothetical protein
LGTGLVTDPAALLGQCGHKIKQEN